MTDHSNVLHSTFVVARFFRRGQTFWNCNFRLHFQALNAWAAMSFILFFIYFFVSGEECGKQTEFEATPTEATQPPNGQTNTVR